MSKVPSSAEVKVGGEDFSPQGLPGMGASGWYVQLSPPSWLT
ncbi:MAG: hypothetical protein ABSE52_07455 [Candidatus Dormibacteria bacterium]